MNEYDIYVCLKCGIPQKVNYLFTNVIPICCGQRLEKQITLEDRFDSLFDHIPIDGEKENE
ncbi:MAG: hypothetical protein GY841_20035 [FCB group bacterium]|nr:hypothetical protein [FCB group bacterium]